MFTFKHNLGQRVEYKGSSGFWIAERMRQEVLHPEFNTVHINELYLVVPYGMDYTAFAECPDSDYVDVDDVKPVQDDAA